MKQMNRVNDLRGKRFGRLLVIGVDDRGTKKTYWYCQCDCGNVKSIRSDALIGGMTHSCGCMKHEQDKINLTKHHNHKMSGTRIYSIWQGMKSRCFNVHNPHYYNYGGRGITVCEEWKNDFNSFYEWAMANGYSDELTIDRIDNDGIYEPGNCRWATAKGQSNNRSSNIKITIGNSTRTLTEWCEIFNLNFNCIAERYKRSGFVGIDELFNG